MTAPLPPERVAELAEALLLPLSGSIPPSVSTAWAEHLQRRSARLANALAPLVARWLADDPAQATLARVEALQREWHGRATEATSEPLSWRRVSTDLRAALVPDHDHEGGK